MRPLLVAALLFAACGGPPTDEPLIAPPIQRAPLRIDAVSPSRASVEGGEPAKVLGAGFCNDVLLTVDDRPVEASFENSNELVFTLPAARSPDRLSLVDVGVRCGDQAASRSALTYDPDLVVRPIIIAYGPVGDRIRPDTGVWVQFNRAMEPETFNGNLGIEGVQGTVRWDADTFVAAFVPHAPLPDAKRAVAFIQGGDEGVRSSYGDPLSHSFQWRFTTCKSCGPQAP